MRLPNEIEHDFRYYKLETHFRCDNCKTYLARFINLKVDGDKILWIFNCSNCGENWTRLISYSKLRETFYRFTYSKESGLLETLWRCFRLGLYRDEVFKFEHDKDDYKLIICRLHKDTSGIRNFWYRRKYVKKNIRQKFAKS